MPKQNYGSYVEAVNPGDRDYFEYLKIVMKGRGNPQWFIESQLGFTMFPVQADIMNQFYLDKYKRLIIVAGMRSGKSALAAMMTAYELFLLLTLPNPAEHYGLLPNQPIFVSVIATSEKQANDSVFANTRNMIENSDFFQTWTNVKCKESEVTDRSKNITIRLLSSWSTTAVGRSNKAVTFDELANFEDTNGKRGAWEVYSRLSKSTDTFDNDGHVIGISSPKTPTDIIMTLYKQGLEQESTLSIMKPTWEMNPRFNKEALMEEHKYNLGMFWRDYACQPQVYTATQFPEGVKLSKKIKNVFDYMPSCGDGKSRVCSIDPAVKNDSFGISVGWKDNLTEKVVIDGVRRFQRLEGDAYIKPSDVKAFLDRIIEPCGVFALVFDTWMFPELIEHVETKYGIETYKHIVGKEDYDRWREQQETGMVEVVNDDVLRYEAENLRVIESNRTRVDHPFGGSKDMADTVANTLWFLSTHESTNYVPALPIMTMF